MKSRVSPILTAIVVVLVLGLMPVFPSVKSQSTQVYVTPKDNLFNTGSPPPLLFKFNVTIWVTGYNDLYAYQVYFVVNDTALNIARAWTPNWDSMWVFNGRISGGPLSLLDEDLDGFNEAAWIGCALFEDPPGEGPPPDPAMLAIVELQITKVPTDESLTSILDISALQPFETYLLDSGLNIIPATMTNGFYEYRSLTRHDVAIAGVTSSRTVLGQNCSARIRVTATNQGNYTETFNITTYANTAILNQTQVTLVSGKSTTISFFWNASRFALGQYTLSANATPVPGETDTADNTCIFGTIRIVFPDVNSDGIINATDLSVVTNALGSSPGHPRWDPRADIDGDNDVDQDDLCCVYCALGGLPQNLAVIAVNVSKTIVGENYAVEINATVQNQGTLTQNVTLGIGFGSDTTLFLPEFLLEAGASTTKSLDAIPTGFLFEEISRTPTGEPHPYSLQHISLTGTGTSLRTTNATITAGSISLPAQAVTLYDSGDNPIMRHELMIKGFTTGDYDQGLYVVGTDDGTLMFVTDTGNFGQLSVGKLPIKNVTAQGLDITIIVGNEIVLLRRPNTDFKLPKGNYEAGAQVLPIVGETDTTDNYWINGTIIVAMVGDVAGGSGDPPYTTPDGKVDILDLSTIATRYGRNYPDPLYVGSYDLDGNGNIEILDLSLAAINYGKTDP